MNDSTGHNRYILDSYVWVDGKEIPSLEFYKNKPIDYESHIEIINNEARCSSSLACNPYVDYKSYLNSKGYAITGHIPYTGYCVFQLEKGGLNES